MGREAGSPLTTSESWASWYYFDDPKLDWGWLLDWAKWSVDDAIACKFWGWTPHNYAQPQFANLEGCPVAPHSERIFPEKLRIV